MRSGPGSPSGSPVPNRVLGPRPGLDSAVYVMCLLVEAEMVAPNPRPMMRPRLKGEHSADIYCKAQPGIHWRVLLLPLCLALASYFSGSASYESSEQVLSGSFVASDDLLLPEPDDNLLLVTPALSGISEPVGLAAVLH